MARNYYQPSPSFITSPTSQWTRFPNLLAYDDLRQVDMLLKSINQSLTSEQQFWSNVSFKSRLIDEYGVMVIVVGNGYGDMSSNLRRGSLPFYISLIPLGKVGTQLFSLKLWVNSRTDWFFSLGEATSLREGKPWIQTCQIPLKNWPCVTSCPCGGIGKYIERIMKWSLPRYLQCKSNTVNTQSRLDYDFYIPGGHRTWVAL